MQDNSAGQVSSFPQVVREIEDFVAQTGWNNPPQLFALASTSELIARQPELGTQVDSASLWTPIAQDPLPEGDLAEALGGIAWPESVEGCALTQEIIVLPPAAEAALPTETADAKRLRDIAAEHPERREARLAAAVLRDGTAACVLRLRGVNDQADELIEHPDLAPNLISALLTTLRG